MGSLRESQYALLSHLLLPELVSQGSIHLQQKLLQPKNCLNQGWPAPSVPGLTVPKDWGLLNVSCWGLLPFPALISGSHLSHAKAWLLPKPSNIWAGSTLGLLPKVDVKDHLTGNIQLTLRDSVTMDVSLRIITGSGSYHSNYSVTTGSTKFSGINKLSVTLFLLD